MTCISIGWFGLVIMCLSLNVKAQLTEKEHIVKSAMLIKMVEFTTWPNNNQLSEFRLAFISNEKGLLRELQSVSLQKKIHGKYLKVVPVDINTLYPQDFHIVYVGKNHNNKLYDLANQIRKTETLLISNMAGNSRDLMLNFLTQVDGKLNFEVNRTNIIFEQLEIDRQLLLYGGKEIDVAELFRASEYALQQIKSSLFQSQASLAEIKANLKQKELSLTQTNDALRKKQQQIQSQQQQLQSYKKDIGAKETLLRRTSAQLNNMNYDVKMVEADLQRRKKQLADKEHENQQQLAMLEHHKSQVVHLNQQITDNNNFLTEQGKRIKEQADQISQQQGTIVSQSKVLWVSMTTLVIFAALILITLKINSSRRRSNQLLKLQKDKVEQKNREIIATQQQLLQAEKMASLGTLTAGVAHEINNPTNFVHVSVQNLEVDLSKFEQFILEMAAEDEEADESVVASFKQQFDPLYQHITTIKDGSRRIQTIVHDLRAFTHHDKAQKTKADIGVCIKSTVNLIRTSYCDLTEFIEDLQPLPQLLCYPAKLNQVFMNLLVNAIDAIREDQLSQQGERANQAKIKGKIQISCHSIDEQIIINITDNGCGMSEITQKKLFEPFYTTKPVGKGTGLGLSISYGIIQDHHGELSVNSQQGEGTTFTIRLPTTPQVAI